MTNQELLSGFLDRSLNEDQLLEFEKRQLESPEFAQEVREMLTVENLLTESTPRVRFPIEFLASVESSVAAKVVAGAAAAGILGTLTKSVWAWVASGAAVAVTGGAIYYVTQQMPASEPAPAVSVKKNESMQVSAPAVAPVVERAPTPVTIKEVTSVDVDAKTTTTNSVMDQLRADYESCAVGKDPVRCSQLALQLGRKYRQVGQGADALKYLQAAVDNARTARLAQFETDALGELGLLAKSRSNYSEARGFFQRAIDRATSAKLSPSKWQSELEQLPNE
ncbi:MAG: hypothetical protein ACK45E_08010 [Ignavibacteria bacterium]|jgi:hypothetical protein